MRITERLPSLRWRLPLVIMAVLATIGMAFIWTAYREVRHALRQAGDDRIHYAAIQLADLLAQSAAGRVAESRRLASDAAVRRFVLTGEDADAALNSLAAAAQKAPQAKFWLSARGGATPMRLTGGNVTITRDPGGADPPTLPVAEGVGPLRLNDGQVTYRTTAIIAPQASQSDGSGYLAIDRPLNSSSGGALIERLLGSGAALKFGNAAGDLWTDLSKAVSGPPRLPAGQTTTTFTDSSGTTRLGTEVPIVATPWHVWVEFSEASFMQPADTLFRRMLPWTVGFILAGVLAVGVLSRQITTPLERVADAADAIASGTYSRRVIVTGSDEVGRLGMAFNVMATRVAESHEGLEQRVQARTQELNQTREEMDQFFAMSLDLLCIAGVDGRFRRVNPAWQEVLGWTDQDLTAVPYVDLVHPEDAAATNRESAKLADGGETVNFENRYRCKDGSYRWLSWKAASNLDRGLIYATARDVTDEKRDARALRQLAAELTASNHELEAFSYSVSHDLRAPLRSVDGFSQALLEDHGESLGPQGQGHLHRIRSAAQHMGRLIDDLLKLARVTRAELHFENIDLSAMAQDTLAGLADAHQERTVEWHVQPGLAVRGDTRLMQIALTNLLENAWKFTGKCHQPRIDFGTRAQRDGTTEYFVKDNGAGFDSTYAAKLFGAFQRLHRPGDFPGTGIGLATVQRIVTRHGGNVRAEGATGHGATFSFTLPLPVQL